MRCNMRKIDRVVTDLIRISREARDMVLASGGTMSELEVDVQEATIELKRILHEVSIQEEK